MSIRVEEVHGIYRIIVSITKHGVLNIHFIDRDSGEVCDQWTEGEFLRRAEKVANVRVLVSKARELEKQEQKKEQEDPKL